ncbi:lactoylglutathione lyase [Salpingoeca rosetta]|uniref:Lactoylglutathione lyase n=1 Tax=Salpingoeca rosetta (strain ATCC 50818 / BSB-021) TaxID=946362 RepID=F2TZP1_SALR5|nr:lactoylglutathione lyase [Salpingoeca rosetta]EGD79065.1 lactoylglutathione lyase [Salpingoeca rosetta]|eukprot:XP_004998021.1 lactoylglutathione lyase [Salpingoeca rosetta]
MAARSLIAGARPFGASWQQTMLRIRDPAASLRFYTELLGFSLIHKYDFPENKFSLYFLATLPKDVKAPKPGTKESEQFLWTMPYTCLELTHNHGTETDPNFHYDSGNNEPKRGFGHICVFADDVYAACDYLEKHDVSFKKKPDEGRMKGLAFAYDPDGYWVEIVKRAESHKQERFTFAQTMLRIKDPEKSLAFYKDKFGMSLVRVKHFSDFSLYFLAHLPVDTKYPDPESDEANEFIKTFDFPVLELTHNHGTESDPNFSYHNGNTDPRGFGHVGFLVDDLKAACDSLIADGIEFKKKPEEGTMRNIAFAYDPDGYWVEIIQRGVTFM